MEADLPKESDLDLLNEALDQGDPGTAEALIRDMHASEVALALESLPQAQRDVVWGLVEEDDSGDVLAELNDEVRSGLLEDMDTAELRAATEGMELDVLADVVADLPEDKTTELIDSLDDEERERLEVVLSFPEDTAGGLMNPATISVRRYYALEHVLDNLRRDAELPDNTLSIFVIDRNERYVGSVSLTKLLTSSPQQLVEEVMDTRISGITADTSATEVAQLFQDKDLVTAPVIDDDGRLIGQITVDDVVDVIREQADHEILGKAGLDEEDDIFAPVTTSARRRAVWLGINLATAFLAAAVVGMFEATLAQLVILAVLMPVVASMGGIAGTQTLTLMVRSMALGRVNDSNARWLMMKEFMIGVLNGLVWAVVVGIITVTFFSGPEIALLIAAAVALNLIIAAIAGFLVPVILQRINIDPAIAGGVVLTTVTDVVGFASFLGLGAIFLT
ncbi:MAG: magnesium transporter [Gammaproteobacteria bacterium]|nr:magnesium transporter [Gammaproteobacteria bacterium]NND55084.1 magnesium transporter [Gammaproteobacteria bacterium]